MGWLSRLFPGSKKPASKPAVRNVKNDQGETVPPERVGLNGEYDQSGLAKRVAAAFDDDSQLDDIDTLWVAQTGSTVVLKGKVPNQNFLNRAVSVAKQVDGASRVDTDEVTVG